MTLLERVIGKNSWEKAGVKTRPYLLAGELNISNLQSTGLVDCY